MTTEHNLLGCIITLYKTNIYSCHEAYIPVVTYIQYYISTFIIHLTLFVV